MPKIVPEPTRVGHKFTKKGPIMYYNIKCATLRDFALYANSNLVLIDLIWHLSQVGNLW